MNDNGFTKDDCSYSRAGEMTKDYGMESPEHHRMWNKLNRLSFPQLMADCTIPPMTKEDVQWLVAKGWKDTGVKDYMTQECFLYVKRLVEEHYVAFKGGTVSILRSMWDYPDGDEERAVESS